MADSLRTPVEPMTKSIVPIKAGRERFKADFVGPPDDTLRLEPLTGSGGLQTAAHTASYADGAAAVVVESDGRTGRRLLHHGLSAGNQESVIERMVELADSTELDDSRFVADHSVVVLSALQLQGMGISNQSVPSTLALGSTPSINGVRMLVDIFHHVEEVATVLSRGAEGQIAAVSLSERWPLPTDLRGSPSDAWQA